MNIQKIINLIGISQMIRLNDKVKDEEQKRINSIMIGNKLTNLIKDMGDLIK